MSGCKCDGCGSPEAAPTQWGDDLCPACATHYALSYVATDHLQHLLKTALSDYVRTWAAHPYIIQHAADEAGLLARRVADEVLAEMKPATRRNLKLKSA